MYKMEHHTKMAIFNSNGLIYNIYPNLPKISFIHKMSKKKPILETSTFKYPKWKFASEIGHFVSLSKLTQNFNFKISKFKIRKMSKIKIRILEIS